MRILHGSCDSAENKVFWQKGGIPSPSNRQNELKAAITSLYMALSKLAVRCPEQL